MVIFCSARRLIRKCGIGFGRPNSNNLSKLTQIIVFCEIKNNSQNLPDFVTTFSKYQHKKSFKTQGHTHAFVENNGPCWNVYTVWPACVQKVGQYASYNSRMLLCVNFIHGLQCLRNPKLRSKKNNKNTERNQQKRFCLKWDKWSTCESWVATSFDILRLMLEECRRKLYTCWLSHRLCEEMGKHKPFRRMKKYKQHSSKRLAARTLPTFVVFTSLRKGRISEAICLWGFIAWVSAFRLREPSNPNQTFVCCFDWANSFFSLSEECHTIYLGPENCHLLPFLSVVSTRL